MNREELRRIEGLDVIGRGIASADLIAEVKRLREALFGLMSHLEVSTPMRWDGTRHIETGEPTVQLVEECIPGVRLLAYREAAEALS